MFKKGTLIPFLMAGDPSLEVTVRLAVALIEEGAGALELGVPYSDALADGPVIQEAAKRALDHGVALGQVLDTAARIHAKKPDVPLIIFSYLNPLLQFGLENYVQRARECGVAATLTVDLPPEEAIDYIDLHARHGLKTVFLSSPTTNADRLPLIDRSSTGFIYVVSRAGVTGVQNALADSLAQDVKCVRDVSRKALAVGFGINTHEQATQVARLADAVVVGSAFVKLAAEHSNDPVRLEAATRAKARELIQGIRRAENAL